MGVKNGITWKTGAGSSSGSLKREVVLFSDNKCCCTTSSCLIAALASYFTFLLSVILYQVLHAIFLITCIPERMSKFYSPAQGLVFVSMVKYLDCSKCLG